MDFLKAFLANRIRSEDFEELTSLDEKWDEWLQHNFGIRRTDGKAPLELALVKSDLI